MIIPIIAGADAGGAQPIYTGCPALIVNAVCGIAVVGLVATVIALFRPSTKPRTKLGLLAVWMLLPPLWFWVEYFYIFKPHAVPGVFDQFKYGQDISAKIWAATVALITAVLVAERKSS